MLSYQFFPRATGKVAISPECEWLLIKYSRGAKHEGLFYDSPNCQGVLCYKHQRESVPTQYRTIHGQIDCILSSKAIFQCKQENSKIIIFMQGHNSQKFWAFWTSGNIKIWFPLRIKETTTLNCLESRKRSSFNAHKASFMNNQNYSLDKKTKVSFWY